MSSQISKRLKNTGTDQTELEKFRAKELRGAKKLGMSDDQAAAHAEMMVGMYGHHFRRYE